ncbi:unnamed protein product [Caenorhabditis angaria]|uniref:Aminotransferase class I/classII large domain-containing protein n=1 Tax=Caenorhabditis angaria TaxID=860376 RepID=A0A9P1IVF3_9PELO|nr:unnamed protein product [Caenorhabditis angaria]
MNKSDKKHQEEPISYKTTATVDLNDSRISIDDVFNVSKTSVPSNDQQTIGTPIHIPDCEPTTSTEVLSDEKTSQSTAQLNLEDVFNVSFDRAEKDVNDEKLKQRISEFEMNKSHKKPQDSSSVGTKQSKANLDDSAVSLDDVFNTNISKDHEEKTKSDESEKGQEDRTHNFNLIGKRKSVAFSDISELYDSGIKKDLDDIYNISQREDNETPKTEFETNITTSSIFLNDSRPSFNRVVKEENEETTETIDDSETTTSTTRRRQIDIPKSDQKNKNLQVVTEDKFNTSSTSTISLDDSFTRQRLPEIDVNTLDSIFLSPPMSNPRSRLVQENSVSSPTRISQEIKYEWIADILSPTSTVVSSAYIDLEDNKQVETNPTLSSVDQIPSTSSFGTTQNISESFSRSRNEPLSPRRYSNFYEERKSISVHPDQEEVDEMYDEYNDFYITSVKNQEVDIDVSHFVDDILGKSLDEAAFLSSTKSLDFKKHTDTSIDRKKKKEEKMTQEEKGQQQKQQDDLINLIFNQSSQSETIVEKQIEEIKNDEEMLEIESNQDYFIVKGSYSLVIPKTDPLGQLLSKLSEEHELATLDFSMTRKLKAMLFECIKERATNEHRNEHPTMSIRGQHLLSSVDNASKTFLKMNDNKYHYKKNPKGIINFCTAENNLCTPLLEERFKHLELFIPNTEHLVRYPPSGGWPETRQILCKYFQQFMNAQVEPNELVLTASTRTGYDVISHCLFEPHDILLTNGPIYTGTISNPNERAQCIVECVPTDLTKKPKLDLAEFQKYYDKLTKEKDQVIGGIIIVNPHNPLGVVFPPEEVIELCNWASKLNLKVVIDEVFANCVYDKDSRFKSYLSYRHRISRPENVTYLWSVSKDFGLPGLKFAVIHTNDESLKLASTKLQYYYPCSALVQDFAVKLLSDFDWLKGFHAEVQRRIRIHYTYTSENLKNLQIPICPQLKEHSEKAELELWNRIAEEVGVMLTPGVHQKCVNFGWFRLVFACTSEELEEGFRRLYKFMKIRTKPLGAIDYLL